MPPCSKVQNEQFFKDWQIAQQPAAVADGTRPCSWPAVVGKTLPAANLYEIGPVASSTWQLAGTGGSAAVVVLTSTDVGVVVVVDLKIVLGAEVPTDDVSAVMA